MAGYTADPRTRLGLIALLAARRVQAEKIRRIKTAEAQSPQEIEAVERADKKTRRSGWFF